MKKINKDNLLQFLNYYHRFHDSYITTINYDVSNANVELFVDIQWTGEPIKKFDGYFETNKTKMMIQFIGVKKFKCKEFFQWDYFNEVYLDYIKLENKELICFSNDKNDSFIYIVCDNIKYKETNF